MDCKASLILLTLAIYSAKEDKNSTRSTLSQEMLWLPVRYIDKLRMILEIMLSCILDPFPWPSSDFDKIVVTSMTSFHDLRTVLIKTCQDIAEPPAIFKWLAVEDKSIETFNEAGCTIMYLVAEMQTSKSNILLVNSGTSWESEPVLGDTWHTLRLRLL